jgi:hypothetical protein
MWNFTAAASASAKVTPEEPEKEKDPFQLGKVFAAIDQYCASIMAMPLIPNNPDIIKCLDALKATKGKLKEAAEQQLAQQKAHMEKLDALVEKAKQAREAHNKQKEALAAPSPPLDGNALGLALLKNMGLIK